MSHAKYIWKPSYAITIRCTWTSLGKTHTYDFKYTGDLMDAIEQCFKSVLGSKYPDFTIELVEHRRV